jgi:organic radical activating enzyme
VILDVLRDVKKVYGEKRITVALTGGEPTCYPGLFDLGK